MRPLFVSLEFAYCAFDASLTYTKGDDLLLFWQLPSAFSQWAPSPFITDLVEHNCAKLFMTPNARLFDDDFALSAILATDDPREQKRLGRQVRHFDDGMWRKKCQHIGLLDNLAKFLRNHEIRLAFAQTGHRCLAEVSTHYKLWASV